MNIRGILRAHRDGDDIFLIFYARQVLHYYVHDDVMLLLEQVLEDEFLQKMEYDEVRYFDLHASLKYIKGDGWSFDDDMDLDIFKLQLRNKYVLKYPSNPKYPKKGK